MHHECHESVFRSGHVANGGRELGYFTQPSEAIDGNVSLMTGSVLPQYAAVTFGSCMLFTQECGVSYICFQGSDSDVRTSGLQATAVSSAPRSTALISGSAENDCYRAECVVLGLDGAVLLVWGSTQVGGS